MRIRAFARKVYNLGIILDTITLYLLHSVAILQTPKINALPGKIHENLKWLEPESMPIKILIVDDHSVVRQGLRMFLNLEPGFEIVGEACNGLESLQQVDQLRPDVVLMDLLMPVMGGIQAIAAIKRDFPDVEVIALTSVLEDSAVVNAVRAGAIGYLLKDTEADELIQAIKAAVQGQVQLSPEAAKRLIREIRLPESPEKLTERESEVLRLLAEGKANKEIAGSLHIGETTVKTHVSNILMKLGMSSRTQAALYAMRIGLIDSSL